MMGDPLDPGALEHQMLDLHPTRQFLQEFRESLRSRFATPEHLRREHVNYVPLAKRLLETYPYVGPYVCGGDYIYPKLAEGLQRDHRSFTTSSVAEYENSVWQITRVLLFLDVFSGFGHGLGTFLLGSIKIRRLYKFLTTGESFLEEGPASDALASLLQTIFPHGCPEANGFAPFRYWHEDEPTSVCIASTEQTHTLHHHRRCLSPGHVLLGLLGCERFEQRIVQYLANYSDIVDPDIDMDFFFPEIDSESDVPKIYPRLVNIAALALERSAIAAGVASGEFQSEDFGLVAAADRAQAQSWLQTGILSAADIEKAKEQTKFLKMKKDLAVNGASGASQLKVTTYVRGKTVTSLRDLTAEEQALAARFSDTKKATQNKMKDFFLPDPARKLIFRFLVEDPRGIAEEMHERFGPYNYHTEYENIHIPPCTLEPDHRDWLTCSGTEWVIKQNCHPYFEDEDVMLRKTDPQTGQPRFTNARLGPNLSLSDHSRKDARILRREDGYMRYATGNSWKSMQESNYLRKLCGKKFDVERDVTIARSALMSYSEIVSYAGPLYHSGNKPASSCNLILPDTMRIVMPIAKMIDTKKAAPNYLQQLLDPDFYKQSSSTGKRQQGQQEDSFLPTYTGGKRPVKEEYSYPQRRNCNDYRRFVMHDPSDYAAAIEFDSYECAGNDITSAGYSLCHSDSAMLIGRTPSSKLFPPVWPTTPTLFLVMLTDLALVSGPASKEIMLLASGDAASSSKESRDLLDAKISSIEINQDLYSKQQEKERASTSKKRKLSKFDSSDEDEEDHINELEEEDDSEVEQEVFARDPGSILFCQDSCALAILEVRAMLPFERPVVHMPTNLHPTARKRVMQAFQSCTMYKKWRARWGYPDVLPVDAADVYKNDPSEDDNEDDDMSDESELNDHSSEDNDDCASENDEGGDNSDVQGVEDKETGATGSTGCITGEEGPENDESAPRTTNGTSYQPVSMERLQARVAQLEKLLTDNGIAIPPELPK
ncbi:unnamed protein product [Amoebophrya sp. A120]|nr:unnamed protein product [Amoebophrya sp. A120]|eukprot:GSA120T00018427001.1